MGEAGGIRFPTLRSRAPTSYLARVRVVLLVFLATTAFARESGYPVMTLLRQETHGGGSQTFDVATDARGRLVFANLEGVLIHDGAWWSRIHVPNDSAFKIAPLDDGTIVVGLLDDVGVIAPNRSGALEYRSLAPQIPPDLRRGLAQAATCTTPGGALIVTDFAAMFWDGRAVRVAMRFGKEEQRRRCFADGDALFAGTSAGLQQIGAATTFTGKRIDALIADFVVVRNEGLFHRDERSYDTDAAQWLKGKPVMDAHRLADGRIAIATLRNGLLLMTGDGRIDQIIDGATGLPEEHLYGVTEDREGALWLALDSSIARIDVSMQVSILDRRVGLRGGLHAITRHEGVLVAGTADGVFAIDQTPAGVRARQIEGIEYPWSLLSTNGDLLVGTFGGIWLVRGTAAPVKIEGTDDYLVYSMRASQSDPSLIWLGMDAGVAKLRRDGDA